MKTIQWEEFVETYQPYQNPNTKEGSYNNYLFDSYQEVIDFSVNIPEFTKNQIWTLVDGDYEESWIISGLHIVNRMGYFVTRIEAKEEIEVDDNEYLTIQEAINACIEIGETILNAGLDKNEVSIEFNNFLVDNSTVGEAKYKTIDYLEEISDRELTDYELDKIHDFYSQLK